ncbi:MAG: hypothetical protein HYT65_02955 [Candidatus Yanofskybacteria bacterium]|nr:hypothetical protein [Candidatus Yanofskybacteria bacterium]
MKIKIFVLLVLIQTVAIIPISFAQKRATTRISRPLELRGSKEQRVAQNTKANELNLARIVTRTELEALASRGVLVELIDSDFYYIDPKPERICTLDARGRYGAKSAKRRIFVYPEVKQYLDQRAREYFVEFHSKFKITSGARSLEEQLSMITRGSPCFNGYAAEAENPLEESLHIRAIAVDVSRKVIPISSKGAKQKERQMTSREIAWMRARLIEDMKLKGIEAEEEIPETMRGLEVASIEENICYHIVVFPKTTETQITPP